MGLKNSQRRKRAARKAYGSSKKRTLPGIPRGPRRQRPPATPDFIKHVLKETAVGNLLAVMFTAIRAEQQRYLADPGNPNRMRVCLFLSKIIESLTITRDSYVAEQQGYPQPPQDLDALVGGEVRPEEGDDSDDANGVETGSRIILPGGPGWS